MPDPSLTEQIPALQEVCAALLAATGSSRTTVRLVDPDGSIRLVAESRAQGVPSMVDGPQPAITAAPTYVELERHRRLIVQGDTRCEPPAPPRSLIDHYRVWAQMLAPVVVGDEMVGTISVHQQEATRVWSAADRSALIAAQRSVTAWCAANGRRAPEGSDGPV
jgi:GAF domain-containing protein